MTEGKENAIEEDDVENEEKLEEEEPIKKKGKAIKTKPTKPSTVVFTRMAYRRKE